MNIIKQYMEPINNSQTISVFYKNLVLNGLS